jgi:hypothetical protein
MKRFQPRILTMAVAGCCAIGVAADQTTPKPAPPAAQTEQPGPLHEVYGTVGSIEAGGSQFTLRTRDGRSLKVDVTQAVQGHRSNMPQAGGSVDVRGTYDAKGVLHAETVNRAKDSPAGWPADR